MASELAARPFVDEVPDQVIVGEVLGGDRARFAVLVQRHNQRLFRAARAILADPAESEDVVQQAWVSAFCALDTFRGEASFVTWVTRIAVHEALSRRRYRARVTDLPTDGVAVLDAADPERRAMLGEIGQALERQLDALPASLRVVVVLRDLLELSTAETARCLGIREEAVRVRLHRGRAALHHSLADLAQAYRFAGQQCARTLAIVQVRIGVDRPTAR